MRLTLAVKTIQGLEAFELEVEGRHMMRMTSSFGISARSVSIAVRSGRREYIARAQRNPRAEVENLIKRDLAAKDGVQVKHLMEYTKVINLTPELEVAMKITEKWNEVRFLGKITARSS